jgi:methylated-DNA-[protein]-cysteine S-methyltransferase
MPILTQPFTCAAGELTLGVYQNKLCLSDWTYRHKRSAIDLRLMDFFQTTMEETSDHPLLIETAKQLSEYFDGKRTQFDVPLVFAGTDFQQAIWNLLMEVPYGKTTTYLALARSYGNEKAIRAVASANGANALSILVPCHRVIGSDGSLIGYAGGLRAKKKLLEIEQLPLQGDLFQD